MEYGKLTKGGAFLCQMINAILLAGITILIIGIYYCVVKAGIPFQAPPLELQIQYAIHMGIGEILVRDGFLISICGGAARLVLRLVLKKSQKK